MTVSMNKFIDHLFSIGGGVTGSIIGFVNTHQFIDIIILAALGATVGWFVKLGLDWCKQKLKR